MCFQLSGYDKNGNFMQRLISAAIQPTEGSAPEIFVENCLLEVSNGDSFILECRVKSFLPVNIQWKKHDNILVEKSFK